MNAPLRCLAALALLLTLCAGSRAQPTDPAEMLPLETPCYVEVCRPTKLAGEVSALLRGSALEDMPAAVARVRAKQTDENGRNWALQELLLLSMFVSPELLNEASRVQAAAAALTGFSKEGEPEGIGIILPGDSNLPTFVQRVYLLAESGAHQVGEVDGIPIYGSRSRPFQIVNGKPVMQPAVESGPYLVLQPGLVLVGSSAAAVKSVLLRYKGRVATPSLASSAAFRDAAGLRSQAGLFAHADLAALRSSLESAKASGASIEGDLRPLLAPHGVRGATASLTLRNGALHALVRLLPDSEKSEGLLNLLPSGRAPVDLLHAAPRDALFAAALDGAEGARNWRQAVAFVDALARAGGQSERFFPSKRLAEVEKSLGLGFADDVFGPMMGTAVALAPTGQYVAAVRATDEAAARRLEGRLPVVAALLGAKSEKRGTEKVGDREVWTLPLPGGTLLGKQLAYGREAAALAFGPDAPAVASALDRLAKREGLPSEPRSAEALGKVGSASLVGLAATGPLFSTGLRTMSAELSRVPARQAKPGANAGGKVEVDTTRPAYERELSQVVAPLGPTVFTFGRTAERWEMEVRLPGLRSVAKGLIDRLIDRILHAAILGGGGGVLGGAEKGP